MESSDFRNLRQALDVGRTLTRFNLPQAEAFNPLGILLAHHFTQLDETQRNATEGAEGDETGDDQPRPEVADAILSTPTTALGREQLGPESVDDGGQGDESGGAGDRIVVRNFRSTDHILPPDSIPIDSIRVDFTAGNMRVMAESTFDVIFLEEGSTGVQEDQSSATNTVAEDQAEVRTSTPLERSLEGTNDY